MQSILFRTETWNQDALLADLWERGTAGIIEEGNSIRAFFEDSVDLQEIVYAHGDLVLETRQEKTLDLGQFEKKDWDGIVVGKRFFVAPSWANSSAPPGRILLNIDTTLAFGTGRHETTQLAIEALELYLQAGFTVLDVGCGSGILSAAAHLLGAGQVISCDVDPNAVTSTQHKVSSVFLGSADSVRSAAVDLTVANITAHILDTLVFEINRITKPDGFIILTGFLLENPPKQWKPVRTLELGDWACWICHPDHSLSAPGELYRPRMDWW